MDGMDFKKKMEEKMEVREWREEVPLPRRSNGIGIVAASVQISLGLWVTTWCNQVILSYVSY
jgi:hypothetical protein